MAQFEMYVPDSELLRVKEAFKAMLQEGDAADIENPTNQEILKVLKRYLNNATMKRVADYERYIHDSQFVSNNIDMLNI